MSQYTPLFSDGDAITMLAGEAILQGSTVSLSGDRTVENAPAGATSFVGVAAFDADQNDNVTVLCGGVHRLIAASTVSPGDRVVIGSNGYVETGVTDPIGMAIAGSAAGGFADVKLWR